MAANGMFGAGKDGLINAPDPAREYTLTMAEVAVFDAARYQVLMDLTVIIDLAKVRDKVTLLTKVETPPCLALFELPFFFFFCDLIFQNTIVG